jgi:hypothetical protein
MIHRIKNYDFEERAAALWDGYAVEFTNEEFKGLKNTALIVERMSINAVVVRYQPGKSEWEDLFL